MDTPARRAAQIGVGLVLLGVQRWMILRPDLEAELDRLGHHSVADTSRQLGNAVSRLVGRLAGSSSPPAA